MTATNTLDPSQRDYQRIEQAIHYLIDHADEQPSLKTVADQAHLTPFHFQRLFVAWAGVSPKEFLQVMTLERAKALLNDSRSLFDTAMQTGLSGPSRLHDLFLNVECMTPGEYKRQAQGMTIHWARAQTPFGEALFAATERGLCYLAFAHDAETDISELRARWPQASMRESADKLSGVITEVQRRMEGLSPRDRIGLALTGTPLRLKVWQALLRVPYGRALSYGQLATLSDKPKAVRAVASCVAANPIAFLIPCHRVIRASGALGEYRWGVERKVAMLGYEQCRSAL